MADQVKKSEEWKNLSNVIMVWYDMPQGYVLSPTDLFVFIDVDDYIFFL